MQPFWMFLFIRIFSGVFMVIMGIAFCLEARSLDSMSIKGAGFFIGASLILLGGFVLIGKRKKPEDRPPELEDRPPEEE